MYNFRITLDRHKERYGYRLSNFPKDYCPTESPLNYSDDPDWGVKFRYKRLNGKKILLILFLMYWGYNARLKSVEKFDQQKRREQRAMQNDEIEEVYGKKVKFLLVDKEGEQVSEKQVIKEGTYVVFWYDAKMKNYL